MDKREGFVATLAIIETAGIWFNKDFINPIGRAAVKHSH